MSNKDSPRSRTAALSFQASAKSANHPLKETDKSSDPSRGVPKSFHSSSLVIERKDDQSPIGRPGGGGGEVTCSCHSSCFSSCSPCCGCDWFVGEVREKWKMFRLDIRFDLPLWIIAFILFVGGIAIGISLFFYFASLDRAKVNYELEVYTRGYTSQLDRSITASKHEVVMLASYLSIRGESATLDEFLQYTNSSLSLNNSVRSLQWIPVVSNNERQQFELDAQQLPYPLYHNYMIKDWNESTEQWVPASNNRTLYHPVLWVSPLETNWNVIGYDLGNGDVKDAVKAASENLTIAVSGKVILHQEMERTTGFLILSPVTSSTTGAYRGLATGVFQLNSLIHGTMGSIRDVTVAICDLNNSDGSNDFIYSSLDESDQMYSEVAREIQLATHKRYDDIVLTVGRTYRVYFVASDTFIERKTSYRKWIALCLPLGVSFLLISLAILFIKYVHHFVLVSKTGIEKIELLSEARNQINNAIQKIVEEEQKNQMIISGISNPIVAFAPDGDVLQANQSFLQLSEYELQELRSLGYENLFPFAKDIEVLKEGAIFARLLVKSGSLKLVHMTVKRLPDVIVFSIRNGDAENHEETHMGP